MKKNEMEKGSLGLDDNEQERKYRGSEKSYLFLFQLGRSERMKELCHRGTNRSFLSGGKRTKRKKSEREVVSKFDGVIGLRQ